MKNFLLFSTICCCALVSCGGSNNSNGQDSKSKEDTSVVEGKIDTVSESVEKADLYTMTDGKFFDLKENDYEEDYCCRQEVRSQVRQ